MVGAGIRRRGKGEKKMDEERERKGDEEERESG